VTIGAVDAVASGGGSVHAALSPYLNGLQRTSDTVAVEQPKPAAPRAADAPPFLNPAIGEIAARAAVARVLAVSAAPQPISPTNFVLYGDSGLLIQSYGAIALFAGPLAIAPVYHRSPAPAIAAVPPVTPYPRIDRTS
jgi:hypothetical protein